jgi:chromosome segregation ATPase
LKISDQALEELRAGRSLQEIRTKFRSSSQVYEGLRTFLEQSDKLVVERKAAIVETAEQLSEKQAELENAEAEVQELKGEVETLRQEKEELHSEITGMRNERDSLKNTIEAMQSQGYTEDIVQKINSIEPRSGAELWSNLRTVSQCQKAAKETAALRKEKAGLKTDIKSLKATKKKNVKLRVETFSEAASTIEMFLADGYSVQDLKSLKAGLDMVKIKGETRESIVRLVEGLKMQGNLMNLERMVDTKKKDHAVLTKACMQLRNESQVIQTVTVKSIEEAREASMKAIASVTEQGKAAAKASASSLERLSAETSAQINAQIQKTIADLKVELGKWGELQQENARLEQFLIPARVLFGIIESPDYLNSIPVPMVVQLFERLHAWCEANLKNFLIQPSQNISTRAFYLPSFQSYDLALLTEFICEGLKLYMNQKNKQTQSSPRHES